MSKLIIFFLYVSWTYAKLIFPNHLGLDYNNGIHRPELNSKEILFNSDQFWVLRLNNLESIILRNGTDEEERDFDAVVAPMIGRSPISRRAKKDNPEKLTKEIIEHEKEIRDIKQEITRIINKFVITAHNEPDSYLTDSIDEESPSLALYFKGDYTSLIVRSGRKQWHYVINPPSPLPQWFYEEHNNIGQDIKGIYVKIPITVAEEFFKSLLPMLRMFLSFPV